MCASGQVQLLTKGNTPSIEFGSGHLQSAGKQFEFSSFLEGQGWEQKAVPLCL